MRREEAYEAAREATEIRRALAKARPDAFLPDLFTAPTMYSLSSPVFTVLLQQGVELHHLLDDLRHREPAPPR